MANTQASAEYSAITKLLKDHLNLEDGERKVTVSGSKNMDPKNHLLSLLSLSNNVSTIRVMHDCTIGKQIDTLKKLLECPVCLKTSGTCMYLCATGHSICSGCRNKVKACPLCKGSILKTRNLLVEQILGTLEEKCKYSKEGCTIVPAKDRRSHLLKCVFRPILCNFAGNNHVCKNSPIKYTNYIKHLMTVHNMKGIKGTVISISQYVCKDTLSLTNDLPWRDWPIQYMDTFDAIFITGSSIKSGVLFWWMYVFGDRQVADKFVVRITLENKNKQMAISWSGPVVSIRTNPDTIKNLGLCLKVCKDTIRHYASVRSGPGNSTRSENDSDTVGWDLVFRVFEKPGSTTTLTSQE